MCVFFTLPSLFKGPPLNNWPPLFSWYLWAVMWITLVSLYLLTPSRSKLKLLNIPVTPKLVRKFTTDLDSLNVSGLDCIPLEVLKNVEPEILYISVELLNKLNCVRRNLIFQISVKSYQWFLYFRILRRGLQLTL